MSAVVGIAGLQPTVDAIKVSKTVALANKEHGNGVAQALFEKGLVAMEWVRVDATTVAEPALSGGRSNHT